MEGGKVVLRGQQSLDVSGTVQAAAIGGQWRPDHATATDVVVQETAILDASGPAGGGEVLVGGGWRGQGQPDGQFHADGGGARRRDQTDATNRGDGHGGAVGDGKTRFARAISARGINSGNSGKAEVSDKASLVYRGRTDLERAKGRVGTCCWTRMIWSSPAGGR